MGIAKVFATACEKDGKNFFTVPKTIQKKVEVQIEADGFIILNDGTVVPADEVEDAE